MDKSRINKCRRSLRDRSLEERWFIARRKRNRVRNKMQQESRWVNRGKR